MVKLAQKTIESALRLVHTGDVSVVIAIISIVARVALRKLCFHQGGGGGK